MNNFSKQQNNDEKVSGYNFIIKAPSAGEDGQLKAWNMLHPTVHNTFCVNRDLITVCLFGMKLRKQGGFFCVKKYCRLW